MTEKEIILLGFKREEMDDDDYYYAYDIARGFTFISNAKTEPGEDGGWYVEFFDSDPAIRFTEFGEVQGLINQLTGAVVKLPKA
jgi:hypothetical protein